MMKRHWLNRVRVSPGPHRWRGAAGRRPASPASAQVVQVTRADSRNLVGFNLGYFLLKGEDSRDRR